MTYQEALTILYDRLPAYHRIGKAAYKANLDNTLAMDEYFGHPHRHFKTVHIAGTNGKGSVSHLTASILQEAGLKTGLYTSPHLRDFRERIRINGNMIPEDNVAEFVEQHAEIMERLQPSFFELTMAMAFDYFAREGVDVAVVETGMGGRLDSTNIITPEVSVITNIGHDHMEFLGDTLQAVAMEKAGIIKEKVPVIIGETQPETEEVFKNRSAAAGSDICFADKMFKCSLGPLNTATCLRTFSVTNINTGKIIAGEMPLGGTYQKKNLQTVTALFDILKAKYALSDCHLLGGIRNVTGNTGFSGRWQILSSNPLTICDTGHNREGLEYVTGQLQALLKARMHMVIGFVNDKDVDSVLPLFPDDAMYYFTRASIPRAMDEKLLKRKAGEYGLNGQSYPTVKEAIKAAQGAAGFNDLIFIGGSTFIVAEAL